MKRYLISSLLVLVGVVNSIAAVHGDHGRAYELNGDGSGSSALLLLMVIGLGGFALYMWIFGNKDKKS